MSVNPIHRTSAASGLKLRMLFVRIVAAMILGLSSGAAASAQPMIERISAATARVETLPMGGSVIVGPFLFASNSAALDNAKKEALEVFATGMRELGPKHFKLKIAGHADPFGTRAQVVGLAARRANAVARAITATLPLDAFGQVDISSLGASALKHSAPVDHQANRRVEIVVTRLSLPYAPPPDWSVRPHAPEAAAQFRFTGAKERRSFAIHDTRLDGASLGVIDVWFSPEWQKPLGYHPAVFTMVGDGGVRQALHILEDRSGLALWDGSTDGFISIGVDLQANRPYHLAIVTAGNSSRLILDGVVLDPALPVGAADKDPRHLVVGSGPAGEDAFVGRIAQLRFWGGARALWDVERLADTEGAPGFDDPLGADLVALTQADPDDGRIRLRVAEPPAMLADGWFSPLGEREFRIRNTVDFTDGVAPPVFAPLQRSWLERGSDGRATVGPSDDFGSVRNAIGAEHHPVFAHGPLFRLINSPGVPEADFDAPAHLRADGGPRVMTMPGGRVIGVRVDGRGVAGIDFASCARAAAPDGDCPAGGGGLGFALDAGETLRGVAWAETRSGAMRDLRFYTASRISTPRGGLATADDPVVARHERYMPAGVRPAALLVHPRGIGGRPAAITFRPPAGVERPAVTLVSDAGVSTRFARLDDTRFESLDRSPDVLEAIAPDARPFPRIEVIDEVRFRLDGVPADFELLDDHREASGSSTFNDTFVSLSKAVNLDSNYVGYDILEMDPLHLTRTGAEKQVFAMPGGDTADYYDANRIFVPRGLIYTPEFTGEQHGQVDTSTSYGAFQASMSNSVNAGIGGKLAPVSFSASATMQEARASITEQKITRTQGLSRAVFYSLTLDAANMRLSDAFVTDVVQLLDRPDYDAFMQAYGSHYATAVVYGGLGVLQIDATEKMTETMRQQGIDTKAEVGVLLDAESKTRASAGYERNQSSGATFRDVVGQQTETFFWVGGTHAGAEHNSWAVGTDGAVPIHVTLRPIDELLNPAYFDDPAIFVRVRAGLRAYAEARLNAAAAAFGGDEPDDDWVVEVRIDSVRCSTRDPDAVVVSNATTENPIDPGNPVILTSMGGPSGIHRNFVPGYSIEPDDEAIGGAKESVSCPSFDNMLERSAFMGRNALSRFRMTEADLADPAAAIAVFDRRDIEGFNQITQSDPENPKDRPRYVEEMTSGGPDLKSTGAIASNKSFLLPPYVRHGRSLREALCGGAASTANACPALTAARLDAVAGRWVPNRFVSPVPEHCFFCAPRTIDYSVRVFR